MFVGYNSEVIFLALHLAHETIYWLSFGNNDHFTNEIGHDRCAQTFTFCAHEIFCISDTHNIDVFFAFLDDRQTAITLGNSHIEGLRNGHVVIDGHHVGSRHHHFTHHRVAKLNY